MPDLTDGVRAYWDGKQFLSRQGNQFLAPDWFIESLPSSPLDGELWLERKKFQRTVSIVRRKDRSDRCLLAVAAYWRWTVPTDEPRLRNPKAKQTGASPSRIGPIRRTHPNLDPNLNPGSGLGCIEERFHAEIT